MKKFSEERINKVLLNSDQFKYPIPLLYVKPKTVNEKSCVLIFVGGIAQTNGLACYMDNKIFDTNYLVSYEKMAHGENKNPPSQYRNKFIKELDCVVDWVKKNFPNKKIFLIGESWGAGINFIYLKKFKEKINGTFNWNMPTKIINPQKQPFKKFWVSAWKEIATLLFNVNLILPIEPNHRDALTQNEFLKRVSKMTYEESVNSSSKLTVAVWKFFGPSRRFLLKNCNNKNFNFVYVQSGQDALINKKFVKKLKAKADSDHFVYLETGYHILSMEPKESEILFSLMNTFIQK